MGTAFARFWLAGALGLQLIACAAPTMAFKSTGTLREGEPVRVEVEVYNGAQVSTPQLVLAPLPPGAPPVNGQVDGFGPYPPPEYADNRKLAASATSPQFTYASTWTA